VHVAIRELARVLHIRFDSRPVDAQQDVHSCSPSPSERVRFATESASADACPLAP
jgi:hypothetical protein